MEVIAEGAETEADADGADRAGCEYVQGFVYGRPMTAAEASKLLFRTEVEADSQRVRDMPVGRLKAA